MDNNYVEILMFDSFGEANEAIGILTQHEIEFQLTDMVMGGGQMLTSATGEHQIRLSVKQEDAVKVRELLSLPEEASETKLQQTLVNLSNEELLDVISSNGEWGAEMVAQAKDLLERRGFTEFSKVEDMRQHNVLKRRMGQKAGRIRMIIGFVSALLAGPLGILMGYFFATLKTKDADGIQYYVYDHDTRQAGWVMLTIGIVSLVLTVIGAWSGEFLSVYFDR